jgi:hypothetical protein
MHCVFLSQICLFARLTVITSDPRYRILIRVWRQKRIGWRQKWIGQNSHSCAVWLHVCLQVLVYRACLARGCHLLSMHANYVAPLSRDPRDQPHCRGYQFSVSEFLRQCNLRSRSVSESPHQHHVALVRGYDSHGHCYFLSDSESLQQYHAQNVALTRAPHHALCLDHCLPRPNSIQRHPDMSLSPCLGEVCPC